MILTTPALIDFVDKFAPILPEDVCGYIRKIHRRNVLRNNRLVAQLEEAVVAMNGLEITPIMLKGASTLATAPEERRGVRLMSDLDIMVMPDQARTAVSALCAIGYDVDHQTPPESPRWHVELNRSQTSDHRPAAGSSRPCVPLPALRAPAEPLRPRAAIPTLPTERLC